MTKLKKALSSNRLTVWHQWTTMVGVPAGLAILGWVALQFDGMRTNLNALTVTMGFVQQDIGRHTTELSEINHILSQRH